MANAIYPLFKQSVLTEADTLNGLNVNTATDGPFCALVDTGTYTYSASHQFYSSLTGIVGTDQRITTPTVTSGTFDGDDLTYTSVSGASVEALVIYRHNSGANTTWRLASYYDQSGGGLPVTPNGGNITVTWNASGIFLISDEHAKADIELVDRIGEFNLYSFRYRWEARRQVGFIAQEVQKLLPNAVKRFGEYLAVDYGAVLAAA